MEFQQYVTPDDGRKFTEIYNVQHLTSNTIDPVNKVTITTIQRLFSMLKGETESRSRERGGVPVQSRSCGFKAKRGCLQSPYPYRDL